MTHFEEIQIQLLNAARVLAARGGDDKSRALVALAALGNTDCRLRAIAGTTPSDIDGFASVVDRLLTEGPAEIAFDTLRLLDSIATAGGVGEKRKYTVPAEVIAEVSKSKKTART